METGKGSQGHADAIADNYLIYSNAVKEYIELHPNVTGKVLEADLELPQGYMNVGPWENRIMVDNNLVVWGPQSFDVMKRLFYKSKKNPKLGLSKNGIFYHPDFGHNFSITVPGFVPNDNILSITRVK
ncbi:MAG: type IV pilus biogenesis protein PilM [Sedimenticola sp.]